MKKLHKFDLYQYNIEKFVDLGYEEIGVWSSRNDLYTIKSWAIHINVISKGMQQVIDFIKHMVLPRGWLAVHLLLALCFIFQTHPINVQKVVPLMH